MDRIKEYETIIISVLEDYAEAWNSSEGAIKTQTIIDRQGKHYQLIRLGWKDHIDYVHYCIFHFDIIDEKVWIQENRTDILIAEELVNLGINKTEIVLGLLPPKVRKDTEYAAA